MTTYLGNVCTISMEAQKKGLSSLPIRRPNHLMYIANPHVSVLGNYPVVQLPILKQNSFIPLEDKTSIIEQPSSVKSNLLKSEESLLKKSNYFEESSSPSSSSIVDNIRKLFSEPTEETIKLIENIKHQTIKSDIYDVFINEMKKAIKRYNHLKTPEAKKEVYDLFEMIMESPEGEPDADEQALNDFLITAELINLFEDKEKYNVTTVLSDRIKERLTKTNDDKIKKEFNKLIEYLDKIIKASPLPTTSSLDSSPLIDFDTDPPPPSLASSSPGLGLGIRRREEAGGGGMREMPMLSARRETPGIAMATAKPATMYAV